MTITGLAPGTQWRRGGHGSWAGYGLILPLVAGLAVFQFYPVGVALFQSVHAANPFTGEMSSFVGVANYLDLGADPRFLAALRNTLLYMALTLAIEIPLALALALLINSRMPARGILRIMMLAGLAASETVAVLVWNQLFAQDGGLLNAVLSAVGIGPQPFLNGPGQALPAIVVMTVWKNLGLSVLIFLAGLQNVSNELLDAAALDGAGPWQRFQFVVLPALRRYTVVVLFVATISASRIFTPIILITQGGPGTATANLNYYAYQQAFQFSSFGLAAASTVCMLAILAVITVAQGLLLSKRRQ
jgi:ABC-type sugar transport system permease subunit